MRIRLTPLLVISLLVFACNPKPEKSETDNKPAIKIIPAIYYDYISSYPHDTTSFTEGFLIHDGKLYESTGATQELPQTKSLFGLVDIRTGKIDTKAQLDGAKYFGEGITILNGKVFQLTYKTKIGFIYNAATFKKTGEFTFPSEEGWGLTNDGTSLIMSDGTNILTYLDPKTLQVVKTIAVSINGYDLNYLNELEYVNGYFYANVWTTFKIVKIDITNGKVVGELDLTSLANEAKSLYHGSLEMNGVAYDSTKDHFFVTGKLWPKIYEIKINH